MSDFTANSAKIIGKMLLTTAIGVLIMAVAMYLMVDSLKIAIVLGLVALMDFITGIVFLIISFNKKIRPADDKNTDILRPGESGN
jgi:hypothetical protein